MAWHNLLVSKPARLSMKNRQLVCDQDEGSLSLPLEDIACVVLESPQVSLSSALLAACGEENIAIISCDETHTPNGCYLSFHPHSRQTETVNLQVSWSKPFCNRIWQQLVKAKITNQSAALSLVGAPTERLARLAKEVSSGDPDNREAVAAKLYFDRMYAEVVGFRRHDATVENAALNYGYAILRAAIAREIVQFGFIPALGIHHKSELNAFNLADDLIEPFRPFVDAYIRLNQIGSDPAGLRLDDRSKLVHGLQLRCQVGNLSYTLAYAIHLVVKSLKSASVSGNPKDIVVPSFPLEFGIKPLE